MFRLALFRAPVLSTAALVASSRLQSSQPPAAAGGAAPQRFRIPTRALPNFEVHNVRDLPAEGSMLRVSVDQKQLLISQFPQLGPRQQDPNDVASQYDREHRISLRFRHMDLAAMVAVIEGRLPQHHMQNRAYSLTFDKTATGYSLKGQVTRNGSPQLEDWGVQFENELSVMLEHFLQTSLTQSFGFAQHEEALRRRVQNSNNNNNGGNNNRARNFNGNNNGNNNNNNNNNNQRRRNQNNQNNSNNNNNNNNGSFNNGGRRRNQDNGNYDNGNYSNGGSNNGSRGQRYNNNDY